MNHQPPHEMKQPFQHPGTPNDDKPKRIEISFPKQELTQPIHLLVKTPALPRSAATLIEPITQGNNRMRTLLILSVVVLGFASFLNRKLCTSSRHDDHVLPRRENAHDDTRA